MVESTLAGGVFAAFDQGDFLAEGVPERGVLLGVFGGVDVDVVPGEEDLAEVEEADVDVSTE